MISRIVTFWSDILARHTAEPLELILTPAPEVPGYPVLMVDFSGARSSQRRADAVLTCVRPESVLDIVGYLGRTGLAPAGWLVTGLAALPYTVDESSEWLLELCQQSRAPVYVDRVGLPAEPRRFAAHLRRSARRAHRRGLSRPVTVLSSGRTTPEREERREHRDAG